MKNLHEFKRQENESVLDYLTKAALWSDSIRNGTLLADGRILKDISPSEIQQINNYIWDEINPFIEKEAKYMLKNYHRRYSEYEDIFQQLSLEVFKEFYKYNNPRYTKKTYCFSTFVKNLSKEAYKQFASSSKGVSPEKFKKDNLIRKSKEKISKEKNIEPSQVTFKEVVNDIRNNNMKISEDLVRNKIEFQEEFLTDIVPDLEKDVTYEPEELIFNSEYGLFSEMIEEEESQVAILLEKFFSNITLVQKFLFLHLDNPDRIGLSLNSQLITLCKKYPKSQKHIYYDDKYKHDRVSEEYIHHQKYEVKKKFLSFCENEGLTALNIVNNINIYEIKKEIYKNVVNQV